MVQFLSPDGGGGVGGREVGGRQGAGYKVKGGKAEVQAGITVNKAMQVGVAVKYQHTNEHTAVGGTESKWGDRKRLKKKRKRKRKK